MQITDYSALEHNALFFKHLLGDSKLCAVVKSDAYGHGAVHVARYLDGIADCFAVGSIDEAKQIGFVSKDILILVPQKFIDTEVAVRSGFVLTVDSFDTLNTVKLASCNLQLSARVHIKIDSGMSRLGFLPSDIEQLLGLLRNCPNIVVEGVYSHFYGDKCVDCDKQFDTFMPCAKAIEKGLRKRLTKHIANSGGVLLSSKYCLDMARVGLGLYGYGHPSLAPVKTVVSNVVAIKDVRKGCAVGYGAKYIAPFDGRYAVINSGYAKGFSRSLVGSSIKINGAKLRVVAVCMGMIIADAGGADVCVGDVATLLGDGVNVSNDVVSVYELLCNLK